MKGRISTSCASAHWQIAVLDLESKARSEVLPAQRGQNLNPQWSPDGKSIAFVSDRTGIAEPLPGTTSRRSEHYQLTNVVGAISASRSTARRSRGRAGADSLAFTYFDDGDYTIWQINNPRSLKKAPYRDPGTTVANVNGGNGHPANGQAANGRAAIGHAASTHARPANGAQRDSSNGAVVDTSAIARLDSGATAPGDSSAARSGTTAVARSDSITVARSDSTTAARSDSIIVAHTDSASDTAIVRSPVTIAALLDSAELALPDTTKFTDNPYKVRFQPDYVARPSIGYAPDSYGRSVFGGTTIILSDMLGNHRLGIAGEINGRIKEAQMFLGYTNLGRRLQTSAGFSQLPYYFLSNDSLISVPGEDNTELEKQEITTYIARQLFGSTSYPFNRFTRFEIGGGFNSISRERIFLRRFVYDRRAATEFEHDSTKKDNSLNYAEAHLAYVSDNTLAGYTGPISGRRYRFQVSPVIGGLNWIEYLADYRRYDAIIFNYLTLATRAYASVSVGPDEQQFMKYVARPDFVRGYDRNNLLFLSCPTIGASAVNCSTVQLLGSRVAVANAELRFPLIRRLELGLLPIALPPLEGLFFFDAGMAWSKDQKVYGSRPEFFDANTQRYPLRSYGMGLRLNLFNYAMLRWDYAVPLDRVGGRRGFWTWSLWPSF